MHDEIILVLEHSRAYADRLRKLIRQRFAFAVEICRTFEEARALIERDPETIYLAVCDLSLPDADAEQIIDLVSRHRITALALSGHFDETVHERLQTKAILDYFIKDKDCSELDQVATVLDRLKANAGIEVLVVDDSHTYRHLLRQYLLAYKFRLHEARDGSQALKLLRQHRDIKLVITDFNMPKMDGFELVRQIRTDFNKDRLAIIGLSAQESGNSLSTQFLKQGANDFLYKPFSKAEFFCRIDQNVELLEMVAEIREASNRDYLTHLHNRRYLFDVGGKYFEGARRRHLDLVVAMLDVDRFQGINDDYGQEAGDATLKEIARVLVKHTRETDVVARFGGDQFCIIAVNMAATQCQEGFERIRRLIAALRISSGPKEFGVSISIGVTSQIESSLAGMIRSADSMLKRAKQQGRDRVVVRPIRT